jgi:polyvinyl alcohol dehydrogenase (cytochrome)
VVAVTRRNIAHAIATSVLLVLATPATAAAANPPGCGPPLTSGGEWRTYGGDLSNTRNQVHEDVISGADVPMLATAWVFSSVANGGAGDFTGTPIIADGCTYVASTRGWVFAINADTGQLVWKTKLPYGGGVNGSVGVADRTLPATRRDLRIARKAQAKCKRSKHKHRRRHCPQTVKYRTAGTIYVVASRTAKSANCPPGDPCQGPYAVALDQSTGHLVWATRPIDMQPGSDVYASPIIYNGILMIGVSGGGAELGPETDRLPFEGSLNFIDANTGQLIKKTYTIHPPHQPDDQFAGGGIWSSPAIDTKNKVAFVGAGNPFNPHAQHPHTDAVLKFDINRSSPHFGEIIGVYNGTVDTYLTVARELPCAVVRGNPPPYYPAGVGSCGDIDMDFGASPNLFTDASGRELVGAGQKSGIYHVFDASTMKPVWQTITGPPSSVGGIVGSTAIAGDSIFGPDTLPGYVWSLSQQGGIRWVGPILDGVHWGPPVAYANGVLYSVDFSGFLDAFDARDGMLLAKRPLMLGGAGPMTNSWGGVSIARHTIYADVGLLGLANGFVIAYRPGNVSDALTDVQKTAASTLAGSGGGGGGGASQGSPAVVAGPEAASTNYATPVAITSAGGQLNFTNLDVVQHDVTADQTDASGRPLFHSDLIGLGETAPVQGVDRLKSGQSYTFHCSVHPGMHGTLIVR